ncbi:MAG: VanZ family protein [Pseudomonadales bacterium]
MSVVTILALAPEELAGTPLLWDKANHFMAFFVLFFLLDYSIETGPNPVEPANLAKFGILMLYAVGIECMQWYLGYRTFELPDIAAGFVGLAVYSILIPVTTRTRILCNLRRPTAPTEQPPP